MKTVLISGYYGFNNIGDEAVLGGLLAGLRALPDVEPVVLTADPRMTGEIHGASTLRRMAMGDIRAALRGASLFISGGGSLLQDVTSFRSPLYYLYLLWLAQRAEVPAMMLAQGVGPLRHPINRLLAGRVLNALQAITVRDSGSAETLHALNVTRPPVTVTADLAFLLTPDASDRVTQWWETHIPTGRPVIGVALRHWQTRESADRYTAISDALATLARQTGALLLFLPMQYAEDIHVAEQVAGWTPAESRVLDMALTPREMLALVARCDLILAMRLHTLIFAVHQQTPAFGLAYDPKVRDFAREAGLATPMPWEAITAEGLAEALAQAWTDRYAMRTRLVDSAARLTALAQENITRVRGLLG